MIDPPPTRDRLHLRAHLGVRLERLGADNVLGVLAMSARARTGDGQLSLGALATMVDVAALFGARSSHSAPHVTSHLALRVPTPVSSANLYGNATVVRAGSAAVVSLVHVSDDGGRVVGVATVTSGALRGARGSHRPEATRSGDDFFAPPSMADAGPPIDEFLAMTSAGQSAYRMAFHETLRNVNGVLHGGGGSLVIEQAARHALADAGFAAASVHSLDVHFVAPGLVGPFVAAVERLGSLSGPVTVVVNVTDEGRADRLIAVGLVGLEISV